MVAGSVVDPPSNCHSTGTKSLLLRMSSHAASVSAAPQGEGGDGATCEPKEHAEPPRSKPSSESSGPTKRKVEAGHAGLALKRERSSQLSPGSASDPDPNGMSRGSSFGSDNDGSSSESSSSNNSDSNGSRSSDSSRRGSVGSAGTALRVTTTIGNKRTPKTEEPASGTSRLVHAMKSASPSDLTVAGKLLPSQPAPIAPKAGKELPKSPPQAQTSATIMVPPVAAAAAAVISRTTASTSAVTKPTASASAIAKPTSSPRAATRRRASSTQKLVSAGPVRRKGNGGRPRKQCDECNRAKSICMHCLCTCELCDHSKMRTACTRQRLDGRTECTKCKRNKTKARNIFKAEKQKACAGPTTVAAPSNANASLNADVSGNSSVTPVPPGTAGGQPTFGVASPYVLSPYVSQAGRSHPDMPDPSQTLGFALGPGQSHPFFAAQPPPLSQPPWRQQLAQQYPLYLSHQQQQQQQQQQQHLHHQLLSQSQLYGGSNGTISVQQKDRDGYIHPSQSMQPPNASPSPMSAVTQSDNLYAQNQKLHQQSQLRSQGVHARQRLAQMQRVNALQQNTRFALRGGFGLAPMGPDGVPNQQRMVSMPPQSNGNGFPQGMPYVMQQSNDGQQFQPQLSQYGMIRPFPGQMMPTLQQQHYGGPWGMQGVMQVQMAQGQDVQPTATGDERRGPSVAPHGQNSN